MLPAMRETNTRAWWCRRGMAGKSGRWLLLPMKSTLSLATMRGQFFSGIGTREILFGVYPPALV